jgi:hypothetical protein
MSNAKARYARGAAARGTSNRLKVNKKVVAKFL